MADTVPCAAESGAEAAKGKEDNFTMVVIVALHDLQRLDCENKLTCENGNADWQSNKSQSPHPTTPIGNSMVQMGDPMNNAEECQNCVQTQLQIKHTQ